VACATSSPPGLEVLVLLELSKDLEPSKVDCFFDGVIARVVQSEWYSTQVYILYSRASSIMYQVKTPHKPELLLQKSINMKSNKDT
jgi:hypothetical protein